MKALLFLLVITSSMSQSALAADSNPILCEILRDYVWENCSEEPNSWDIENEKLIKRTYKQCQSEDFPVVVKASAECLTNPVTEAGESLQACFDQAGVYLDDAAFENSFPNDVLECDPISENN